MNLICINCPKGCHLIVEEVEGQIKVTGNSCPRGVTYGVNEMSNPLRTLTTTIAIDSLNCARLPVISSKPLPKGRVMDVMKALKGVKAKPPIHLGDVLVENVLGLETDIIASKSIEK